MNAEEIKKLQADRLRYLERVYHKSEGDPGQYVPWEESGKELEFDRNYTIKLMEWLKNENYIKYETTAHIRITNFGIQVIEDSIANPTEPIGPFVAYNTIHVEKMINSQIQQGTQNSVQNIIIQKNDLVQVNNLVKKILDSIDGLELQSTQKQDLEAEIETIKSQTKSSKPKKQIVLSALSSIRDILKVLPPATHLVTEITVLLQQLGIEQNTGG